MRLYRFLWISLIVLPTLLDLAAKLKQRPSRYHYVLGLTMRGKRDVVEDPNYLSTQSGDVDYRKYEPENIDLD